jgi:hypothetical protein
MYKLDQTSPSELRIAEVNHNRDNSKQAIDLLQDVNKEILNEYLIKQVKLPTATDAYIKKIHIDIKKEVAERICNGELHIEKMKLDRI